MLKEVTKFNWVDLVSIAIIAFYAFEGYSVGFINAIFNLISFVGSFVISLKFYTFVALLLTRYTQIPPGFAKAIGFFAIALITEIIFNIISRVLKQLCFPRKESVVEKLDKILGIIPAALSALVLLSFLLTLAVAFPSSPFIKNAISSAKIGSLVVLNTQGLEKNLNNIFGGAVNETINFLTIEPSDNKTIKFNFKTNKIAIDLSSEQQMLDMVNKERITKGIKLLVSDSKLRDVAISHCEDMLKRGYFSHYTLEGLSPFDRMGQVDISYTYAGENLAFSQNVNLAMQGLMNSKGHRENILSTNFGKIGIGVIDGGIYGEMFCQEFTD